jgi:hypothetical protein
MSKTKKLLVSAFILFNFLAMIRVHLPLDARIFNTLYRPVDAYLSFFSIYQDWMMFAKNPSRMNVYISADVEFDDGTKDTYVFPRPTELSLIDKYVYGERYRKIVSEAIRRDDHMFMWEDTAKFAMRKLKDKNFAKIPLKVHLIRHWNETPDIKTKFVPHLYKNQNYASHKFYTYEVL